MLIIIHALLSDPAAVYTDFGADYYEQRMHARRQARKHVKSLERLGYKVTTEAIDPATGELTAAADHGAKNPETLTRHRVLPRAQPRSIFGPAEGCVLAVVITDNDGLGGSDALFHERHDEAAELGVGAVEASFVEMAYLASSGASPHRRVPDPRCKGTRRASGPRSGEGNRRE